MKRKTNKAQLEIFLEPASIGERDKPKKERERNRPASEKMMRKLKMQKGNFPRHRYPTLRLAGKWLAAAGFRINDNVIVEVSKGCLRISKTSD